MISVPPNLGGDALTILLAGARWIVRNICNEETASEKPDAIGPAAASVRARCSQLKIKLARGAHSCLTETQPRHIQEQKLIVRTQPKV